MAYSWFPKAKHGKKRGRLVNQSSKAKGAAFKLFSFLYVDNGAMLFDNIEDMESRESVCYSSILANLAMKCMLEERQQGLKNWMHISPCIPRNQGGRIKNQHQRRRTRVLHTKVFKYLGSPITSEQNDKIDVDARICSLKLKKPWGHWWRIAMQTTQLDSQATIYLAIPSNFMGRNKNMGFDKKNMKKKLTPVFPHRCILRSKLQINMFKVKERWIKNEEIKDRIQLQSMENLINS